MNSETPSNLKEQTLSMVPVGVVSRGISVSAIGPRIISLVLLLLSCISFLAVQTSRLSKKVFVLELEHFGCKISGSKWSRQHTELQDNW